MLTKSTLERALELAKEIHCTSVVDIKNKLSGEGYFGVDEHLSSKAIRMQLRSLIQARILGGQ